MEVNNKTSDPFELNLSHLQQGTYIIQASNGERILKGLVVKIGD